MVKRIALIAVGLLLGIAALGYWAQSSQLPKYRDGFLYAFGPYEFVRSAQELSAQRDTEDGLFNRASIRAANPDWEGGAFLNQHVHNSRLADHTLRAVTTPNNDTLYTSAVLELSSTPVEVVLPTVGDRYLSIALMDVFTDQFAHIGPRETGGQGGTYWIVGPEDTTPAPDGVSVIRATGNDVWLLARIFVSGQSDLDAARTAQQGISVRPVFPDRPATPFATLVTDIQDSQNFVTVVNEALARNPSHPQSARAETFASIGIGADGKTGAIQNFFWKLVTPRAEAAISERVNQQLSAQQGWSTPPANIGLYGEDDATRAGIALIGFGALLKQDAIYYRMTRTADGAALDGAQNYQLTLPSDVPAKAFWSIAIYEPDETGRFFFFENPTGRHSLNSGSDGLQTEADGSVVLHIGPNASPDQMANWLPTPDGPFAAFFRLYYPTDEAVASGWVPPPLVRE